MAAAVLSHRSPRIVMFIFLFFLSGRHVLPAWSFKVSEGGVASLSCQYSVERYGLSRVCWGRSCGTFWCNSVLVQTDERGVVSEVSDRYRLSGSVLDGQMDLDIVDVRRTDGGTYCCRVHVHGIFNDKKVIMNLRVVRAPATAPPTTRKTPPLTEAPHSTAQTLEHLRRNSTHMSVEVSRPSLSLQINVPVLSLSVGLLLIIASLFSFMTCRRWSPQDLSSCFSSEEPPHIIYEIRMRRPLQENIYTLD